MALPYAIQVFEAPWEFDRHDNLSVKDSFRLLRHVYKKKGDGTRTGGHDPFFSYDKFTDEGSLSLAYQRTHHGTAGYQRVAYFGCHGEKSALCSYATITRAKLKGILAGKSVFRGLYFGSCKFADRGTAQFLLNGTTDKPAKKYIQWMAGYARSVPWIESSLCDLLFFQLLLDGRYRKYGKGHHYVEFARPREVAMALYELYPLSVEMEFSLFYRIPKSGQIGSTLEDWAAGLPK